MRPVSAPIALLALLSLFQVSSAASLSFASQEASFSADLRKPLPPEIVSGSTATIPLSVSVSDKERDEYSVEIYLADAGGASLKPLCSRALAGLMGSGDFGTEIVSLDCTAKLDVQAGSYLLYAKFMKDGKALKPVILLGGLVVKGPSEAAASPEPEIQVQEQPPFSTGDLPADPRNCPPSEPAQQVAKGPSGIIILRGSVSQPGEKPDEAAAPVEAGFEPAFQIINVDVKAHDRYSDYQDRKGAVFEIGNPFPENGLYLRFRMKGARKGEHVAVYLQKIGADGGKVGKPLILCRNSDEKYRFKDDNPGFFNFKMWCSVPDRPTDSFSPGNYRVIVQLEDANCGFVNRGGAPKRYWGYSDQSYYVQLVEPGPVTDPSKGQVIISSMDCVDVSLGGGKTEKRCITTPIFSSKITEGELVVKSSKQPVFRVNSAYSQCLTPKGSVKNPASGVWSQAYSFDPLCQACGVPAFSVSFPDVPQTMREPLQVRSVPCEAGRLVISDGTKLKLGETPSLEGALRDFIVAGKDSARFVDFGLPDYLDKYFGLPSPQSIQRELVADAVRSKVGPGTVTVVGDKEEFPPGSMRIAGKESATDAAYAVPDRDVATAPDVEVARIQGSKGSSSEAKDSLEERLKAAAAKLKAGAAGAETSASPKKPGWGGEYEVRFHIFDNTRNPGLRMTTYRNVQGTEITGNELQEFAPAFPRTPMGTDGTKTVRKIILTVYDNVMTRDVSCEEATADFGTSASVPAPIPLAETVDDCRLSKTVLDCSLPGMAQGVRVYYCGFGVKSEEDGYAGKILVTTYEVN